MIKYEVIQRAKSGEHEAIEEIIVFFNNRIKKFSTDDEFIQTSYIAILRGIRNFQNITNSE